jgi:cell division transport system permease protein
MIYHTLQRQLRVKFNHTRYAFGHALQTLRHEWGSNMVNVFVLAITLLLPLMGYVLLEQAKAFGSHLQGDPEMSVFLKLGTRQADIPPLIKKIEKLPHIERVEHITPEAALQKMQNNQQIGEVVNTLPTNPLPHALVLHLSAGLLKTQPLQADPQQAQAEVIVKQLVDDLRNMPLVDTVHIDTAWITRLEQLILTLKTAISLLSIVLIVSASTVIFNIVRLHIAEQHEEAETLALLGATTHFIRLPHYLFGGLMGGLAMIIALGLLQLLTLPFEHVFMQLTNLYGVSATWQTLPISFLCTLIVCSVCGGLFSAWIATRIHLKIK